MLTEDNGTETNRQGLSITSGNVTPGCTFITGDALFELRKLPAKSFDAIVCSPPYFPIRRFYSGKGIGFKQTLEEYLKNLVAILLEAKRVLTDKGVLWVVIDDSQSTRGGKMYPDPKSRLPSNTVIVQNTTNVRPVGSMLLIPYRFAMAMQDRGWVLRQQLIWNKGTQARPEPVKNRCSKNHETIFMFTKRRNDYNFNADRLRAPVKSAQPRKYGSKKVGVVRNDNTSKVRYLFQMGANLPTDWKVTPATNYRGTHSATLPEELIRRMLLLTCLDDVCSVLDPFGAAGTTALVAFRLGHRATSIEISEEYTNEAKSRIASEIGDQVEYDEAAD